MNKKFNSQKHTRKNAGSKLALVLEKNNRKSVILLLENKNNVMIQ